MSPRRRIAIVSAVVLAGLAAFLGSLRWDLSEAWVRNRLEVALVRDTGYRITALGSASFTALPWPTLQVANLALANAESAGESAAVPLAKARLNLFAWLAGDPQLSALTLFEPRLNLKGADRLEDTDAAATLVTNYLRQGRRPSLSHLRVQAGEVTLDGAPWLGGLTLTASNVASRDLRLVAFGSYRAAPFRLRVEVAPPARAAVRPIAWEFDLGDLAATFNGVLVAPPSLDADGRISIALGAGALRSRPIGLSRELAELLDGVSIRGEGRMSLPQVQLRSVVLDRGANQVSGGIDAVLSMTNPRFAGTLHTTALDIPASVFPEGLANALAGDGGGLSGARWLRAAQADMRFSVDRLNIGGLRLQDVAASAKAGGGRLELSLSEGRIGGGVAKARAVLAVAADRIDARLAMQMNQMDVGAAFGAAAMPLVAGIASGQAAFEASGRSLADILAGASGRGNIAIRNGEIAGLDAERFLRRADPTAEIAADGRSAFRSVDAAWRMQGGLAEISDASIRAPLWSGRIEGGLDLRQQRIDLLARLRLETGGSRRDERSLQLSGPLAAPAVRPAPSHPGRS
jgi:AsmA protein